MSVCDHVLASGCPTDVRGILLSLAHHVSRSYFVSSDIAFFGHRPDVAAAAAGYLGPCECRHVCAAEETTGCVFLFNMEHGAAIKQGLQAEEAARDHTEDPAKTGADVGGKSSAD